MTDWILPAVLALIGGGGIGSMITAIGGRKAETFKQMRELITVVQEERAEAKSAAKDALEGAAQLREAGEYATGQLHAERKWTATLEEWAARGAPPPPPRRDDVPATAN